MTLFKKSSLITVVDYLVIDYLSALFKAQRWFLQMLLLLFGHRVAQQLENEFAHLLCMRAAIKHALFND